MNHINPSQSVENASTNPSTVVGQIRRFGTVGILYEILEQIGAYSCRIKVLETGEELTYPLGKILLDPRN